MLGQSHPSPPVRKCPKAVPHMICKGYILLHLVELVELDERQWIFLASNDFGLKGGVEFAEIDTRRCRTECSEHRSPQRAYRHSDLKAAEIFRCVDRTGTASDLTKAVIPHFVKRKKSELLNGAADKRPERTIHCRPNLVVILEPEADAVDRCRRYYSC